MVTGACSNSYKGAQSASEVSLVLGSASVALVHGLARVALGQDSTIIINSELIRVTLMSLSLIFRGEEGYLQHVGLSSDIDIII